MIGPESRMAFSTSKSSLFGPSESLRSSASGSTLFATSASTLFGAVNLGSTQNQVRHIPYPLSSQEWSGIEIKKLHPL